MIPNLTLHQPSIHSFIHSFARRQAGTYIELDEKQKHHFGRMRVLCNIVTSLESRGVENDYMIYIGTYYSYIPCSGTRTELNRTTHLLKKHTRV